MKKKQTKTGPKSVTGFSILKIYPQEKQQKEDWILNRKRRNRAGFFLGILLLLFGSMPAAAARQESEPNQLFATAACLMDGDTGRVLFGKRETDPMAMASTTKNYDVYSGAGKRRRAGSCDSIRPGGSGTESPSRCVRGRAVSAWRSIIFPDAGITQRCGGDDRGDHRRKHRGFCRAYERKSRCNRLYGYTFCDPKRS